MIPKILSIMLLTPTALIRMDPIEPDVSYTGNNDRYDLSEMVIAHNKMFRDTPQVDDDEDEGVASNMDTRRFLSDKFTNVLLVAIKKDNLPHGSLTRRIDGNFAEDDSKNSFEGGTVSDFEENLKKFHVNRSPSRRNLNDDVLAASDVIMQNVEYSNES